MTRSLERGRQKIAENLHQNTRLEQERLEKKRKQKAPSAMRRRSHAPKQSPQHSPRQSEMLSGLAPPVTKVEPDREMEEDQSLSEEQAKELRAQLQPGAAAVVALPTGQAHHLAAARVKGITVASH